jgi:ubiquinone/menaquinone biosynthesis C-methylase UbiE
MTVLLERTDTLSEPMRQQGMQRLRQFAEEAKTWIASKGAYNPSDGFQQIGVDELYNLGIGLLSSRDMVEAYNLLAQKGRSGRTFYDLVIEPQHLRAYEVLAQAFAKLEPEMVDKGLDVGIGTGESAIILAQKCRQVTGVDLNEAMLTVAGDKLEALKRKRRIRDFSLVHVNALEMEFPPNTFDIILDNGLGAYFTVEEAYTYMGVVRRLLKVGGRYYQYQAFDPDPKIYTTTPRAKLAGCVSACLNTHNFALAHLEEYEGNIDLPEPEGFDGGILKVTGGAGNEYLVRKIKK